MEALYAYMRWTDDLADQPRSAVAAAARLDSWRERLRAAFAGRCSHRLHAALQDTIDRFAIPYRYLEEVIDGVAQDIQPRPFATWPELEAYCYRVASVVGLACIRIWGVRDDRPESEYLSAAVAAGNAFQLTNILRDLGEDLGRGRVYIPTEDWQRFECPPKRWGEPALRNRFEQLLAFEVSRARIFYQQSRPLLEALSPPGTRVFQLMCRAYEGLLERIAAAGAHVLHARVRLGSLTKFRLLLAAWRVRHRG